MSIVGYILGLGDRHPSNLMIDPQNGKVIHIDFGDCFEVAMFRDRFPEKIPFRLTRMLIKAMGVSGVEGSFRTTCENLVRVIRDNKESMMAVLDAFVHDPLVTWGLVGNISGNYSREQLTLSDENFDNVDSQFTKSRPKSLSRKVEKVEARQVLERIQAKFKGEDFLTEFPLNIKEQVERLIQDATSHDKLCQCFIGWCAVW